MAAPDNVLCIGHVHQVLLSQALVHFCQCCPGVNIIAHVRQYNMPATALLTLCGWALGFWCTAAVQDPFLKLHITY